MQKRQVVEQQLTCANAAINECRREETCEEYCSERLMLQMGVTKGGAGALTMQMDGCANSSL
jgi:hypothetical protein